MSFFKGSGCGVTIERISLYIDMVRGCEYYTIEGISLYIDVQGCGVTIERFQVGIESVMWYGVYYNRGSFTVERIS